jgi:cell division septation protein DedD
MADINNEEEKRESVENIDPGAATETVDLNDLSMDKQDPDDVPENNGIELLSDEAVEQPADTSEPEHSEPTGETGETALEDRPEENSLAEELQELAEEDELLLMPEELGESPVGTDEAEQDPPADEPAELAEENEPESVLYEHEELLVDMDESVEDPTADGSAELAEESGPESVLYESEESPVGIDESVPDPPADDPAELVEEGGPESVLYESEELPVDINESVEDFSFDEPVEMAEEDLPESIHYSSGVAVDANEVEGATDETYKHSEDGTAIPGDIFAPEEEMGRIVNAAKTFDDAAVPNKEDAEIEAEKPAEPESTAAQPPFFMQQPIHSGKLPMAALLLGILAVISTVAVGLYSKTLKIELDSLRQQLETTALAPVASTAESASVGQDRLNTHIEDFRVRFEEYDQFVKFIEEDGAAVKARIEKIEQSINSMRMSPKTDIIASPQTAAAMAPNPAETEAPPAVRKGDWIVNLESHINENDADRLLESYRSNGLPVEKFSVKTGGTTWHRLRVTGFSSSEEAKSYIKTTATPKGFADAWIERIK